MSSGTSECKRIEEACLHADREILPAFAEPLHVGRPNIGNTEAFLDLAAATLERRWLTNNGPLLQELERRLAALLGVKHCIAMCNGTIALEIAIRALGLSGEVIVPSFTFIATAHALFWQGITPVFADIDPETHNLDPRAARRMITPRTTGIIGVHLWGRAAPAAELRQIAEEHGLKLIFDAAHAFGASLGNQMIGSFGDAEVFSFHATKFFNTFEGGAVTTNNDELAEAIRLMRNFGFSGFDNVIHPGTNGKMTEICAAMGLVNLDAIEDMIAANRRNYMAYRAAFGGIGGLTLLADDEAERCNFQYVVLEVGPQAPLGRDEIVVALHAQNVLARKYFWPGCHRLAPYRELFPHAGLMLPNTETVADRVIVLPTGTAIRPDMCTQIANLIIRICKTHDDEEIGKRNKL